MSRNFELLQKLEQEHRSQTEVVSVLRSVAASGPSSHHAETQSGVQLGIHFPDELYKLVRRLFLLDPGGPRVVLFSSVERTAGCSWMAAHSAQVLATQTKRSICLVDANLRYPALHSFFEVDNSHGFTDAISHSGPLAKFARQLSPRNLWLLTSGRVTDSDMLLSIDSLRGCMQQLREEFAYTIIDAPPLNLDSHAMLLGATADGIALVLKANSSRRGAAQKLVTELKAANIRLLGAVLNQRTFSIPQAIYDRL